MHIRRRFVDISCTDPFISGLANLESCNFEKSVFLMLVGNEIRTFRKSSTLSTEVPNENTENDLLGKVKLYLTNSKWLSNGGIANISRRLNFCSRL